MKILIVTGGVPSHIGQNHVLYLLKVLSTAHDFTLVSCDLGESYLADSDRDLDRLARVIRVRKPSKNILLRGIRSMFSLIPVAVLGFRFDSFRDAVAAALKESHYDIVIFEQLVTAQYGYLAHSSPKLLFPVDAVSRLKRQRYETAGNTLAKVAHGIDYWMTKKYENKTYGEFDGVLFVSDADAAYAKKRHQARTSKIFVLPLVVDTSYFTPGPQESNSDLSLVFLGNMFNYINEDAILWFCRAVWARLKQMVPDLKLFIVGNDPSPRVRELSSKDGDIFVTGYLKDVRPVIRNSTVFISPLRMGTGIKNRILQGMAMGKAIVASPLSVEGLNVEDGKQLRVARDAEEFYQQILVLLKNSYERVRLSQDGRVFVEKNHSLESIASQFMKIATGIMDSRNSRAGEVVVTIGAD
jgi:glycosyltransferase involved in cell wall biosynthesis